MDDGCKLIHEDIEAWCDFHETATEEASARELAEYFHVTMRLRALGATMAHADDFMHRAADIYRRRHGHEFMPF